MKEKTLLGPVAGVLAEKFGAIDMVSSWFPFDLTEYYRHEMGAPLFRRVLTFKELIDQSALSEIKIQTNTIEEKHVKKGKRRVNIDPGYMIHERFVLATGKNFTHRIYIGRGIYADLTLIYQKGKFQRLPWTYPDYTEKKMLGFLKLVRDKYMADLRQANFEVKSYC